MSALRQAQSIEYANARIRGHRTELFTHEQFERFLNLENFSSFLTALNGTKYRRDIENALALHNDVTAVGYASSEYILREFRFIDGMLEADLRESLRAIGAYWDYGDFKLVLRGVHSGASREELIRSLQGPGIAISRTDLAVLASQESIEELISMAKLMKVPFLSDMHGLQESHIVPEAFAEFEASLDKAFFATNIQNLKKRKHNELVREYFIRQINKRNLMTVVRLIRADIAFESIEDADRYFLEGGTLFKDVTEFKEVSEYTNLEDVAKHLRTHPEGKILRQELAEFYISNSLSSLDRALEIEMLKKVTQIGKRDLFGNGIAIAYLLSLENEVRNLRLLAHGKSFGIPSDEIRREFILL